MDKQPETTVPLVREMAKIYYYYTISYNTRAICYMVKPCFKYTVHTHTHTHTTGQISLYNSNHCLLDGNWQERKLRRALKVCASKKANSQPQPSICWKIARVCSLRSTQAVDKRTQQLTGEIIHGCYTILLLTSLPFPKPNQ